MVDPLGLLKVTPFSILFATKTKLAPDEFSIKILNIYLSNQVRTKRKLDKLSAKKLFKMAPERKHQGIDKTVMPNLPKEVWRIIFSSLPKESRKNATRTCRLWLEIIRGDSRFSGNITTPWIELQNSSFDLDNWPFFENPCYR